MELTWALLLGLAKHIVPESVGLQNNGPWQRDLGVTLGKTLGLLGLGKIGGQMARVAQAFGMRVLAWSQNLTAERAAQEAELAPSKRALFEQSDFVSIHLVLSDRSRGLVGRDELTAMKPTAYLLNTSRAAIVDRAALVDVLQQRKIAGAGLDVFETEPLPADDAFRQLPNVLATPHVGYVADDNYRAYFTEAVEDIAAFLAGQPIRRLG